MGCEFDSASLYWALLGVFFIMASDHADVLARMTGTTDARTDGGKDKMKHHMLYITPRLIGTSLLAVAVHKRDLDTLATACFYIASLLGYLWYASSLSNWFEIRVKAGGTGRSTAIAVVVLFSALYVLAVVGFTYDLQHNQEHTLEVLALWVVPCAYLLDIPQFFVRHQPNTGLSSVSFVLHVIQAVLWPCLAFVLAHRCA
jgi:uncharacterized membrane protein